MTSRWTPVVLLLVLSGSFCFLPSCSSASGQQTPDPRIARQQAEEAMIRRLLEVNGTSALATQLLNRFVHDAKELYPTVPQNFIEEFARQVKPDQFYALMVPVYARHFTAEEIRQLLAFYESPVGQKLVAQMPSLNADADEAVQQWNQQISRALVQQMRAKGSTGYSAPPRQ